MEGNYDGLFILEEIFTAEVKGYLPLQQEGYDAHDTEGLQSGSLQDCSILRPHLLQGLAKLIGVVVRSAIFLNSASCRSVSPASWLRGVVS